MLIELAVGDSYGASFEYAPKSHVLQHNTGLYFSKHPRHSVPPGYYTDDTQMTLAIVEAMLSEEPWTPLNLACRFIDVFKRDPREGYATGFYHFLKNAKSGQEFLQNIKPTSDKSGAAMRTTPLGLLSSIPEVVEKTVIQASLTHNTPDGLSSALAASLLVFYSHKHIGPIENCGAWINEVLNSHKDPKTETVIRRWDRPWEGKVRTKGYMAVKAAITAVSRNISLTELLKDCINFTGDVDTVATIALAAASLSMEYLQDLEESLVYSLENGSYGREYLLWLDRQLAERYTNPNLS